MNKSLKTAALITAGAAAAAAAAAAASYATAKYFVNVALDRQAPPAPKGAEKFLMGSDSEDEKDFWNAVNAASQRLAERDSQTVNITAKDGTPLVGHFVPCRNQKRIIIAMHGWRSTWNRDFGLAADFWHDCGCGVLYAEQRAQGDSGGDYMGFGLIERYDCACWAEWAAATFGKDIPLYLSGVSMGATTVLMASALPMPENLRGIIADCGFTSPAAIWRHVASENLHLPFGVYGRIARDLCRRKIEFGPDDYSTVDALRENKTPVLFIHGADDTFVPVEMTYENYKACAAEKRLVIVPGANHGMSCYIARSACESATREFFASFDGESEKE